MFFPVTFYFGMNWLYNNSNKLYNYNSSYNRNKIISLEENNLMVCVCACVCIYVLHEGKGHVFMFNRS